VPMPEFALPPMETCVTCRGSGKASKTACEECEGEGMVELSNDYSTYYDVTCKSCDGDGHEIAAGGDDDCPDCSGVGSKWRYDAHVRIGAVAINPKFALGLRGADGLTIATTPNHLHFRCGEYRGVIMGMNV
jgi:hypothetical protein